MLRNILTAVAVLGTAGIMVFAVGDTISERQIGTEAYREHAVSQCVETSQYRNTGDAVKGCTAIVQHETGTRSIFP